jgi:tetratricopeptide (TPR) repeat protein
VLGPKIEGLQDNHRSKPGCLFQLSRLFDSVGNYVERKRLLIRTLNLWRERGDDLEVAETLRFLADANRLLNLHKEGIQQAKEALEIHQRHGHILGQALSLQRLAQLLLDDNQLYAAEAAASRAIDLFSGKGQEFSVCQCHYVLGEICRSKGETKESMNHFETALTIASPFNWHNQQFSILHSLAELLFDQGRFDDAHSHIERAKSHVANDAYNLGGAMYLQAYFWYTRHMLEEAKLEALRAVDVFEKLGAMEVEVCRTLLQQIEAGTN